MKLRTTRLHIVRPVSSLGVEWLSRGRSEICPDMDIDREDEESEGKNDGRGLEGKCCHGHHHGTSLILGRI